MPWELSKVERARQRLLRDAHYDASRDRSAGDAFPGRTDLMVIWQMADSGGYLRVVEDDLERFTERERITATQLDVTGVYPWTTFTGDTVQNVTVHTEELECGAFMPSLLRVMMASGRGFAILLAEWDGRGVVRQVDSIVVEFTPDDAAASEPELNMELPDPGPDPVPPIVLDDSGDIQIYGTVEAACYEVEAIDVKDEVYQAFDALGRPLAFHADGDVVTASVRAGVVADPDGLLSRLRHWMQRAVPDCRGLARASLSATLDALLMHQRGTEDEWMRLPDRVGDLWLHGRRVGQLSLATDVLWTETRRPFFRHQKDRRRAVDWELSGFNPVHLQTWDDGITEDWSQYWSPVFSYSDDATGLAVDYEIRWVSPDEGVPPSDLIDGRVVPGIDVLGSLDGILRALEIRLGDAVSITREQGDPYLFVDVHPTIADGCPVSIMATKYGVIVELASQPSGRWELDATGADMAFLSELLTGVTEHGVTEVRSIARTVVIVHLPGGSIVTTTRYSGLLGILPIPAWRRRGEKRRFEGYRGRRSRSRGR